VLIEAGAQQAVECGSARQHHGSLRIDGGSNRGGRGILRIRESHQHQLATQQFRPDGAGENLPVGMAYERCRPAVDDIPRPHLEARLQCQFAFSEAQFLGRIEGYLGGLGSHG
jgi:hypothetical protein